MEGSRVELAENRLILGQFYSTLLPFSPLNPNRPLGQLMGIMRLSKTSYFCGHSVKLL